MEQNNATGHLKHKKRTYKKTMVTQTKLIDLIELLAICCVCSTAIVMAITFYTAYSNPSMSTLVTINGSGEANFEAFVLIPLNLLSAGFLLIKEIYGKEW
jgi:hypothetical protein